MNTNKNNRDELVQKIRSRYTEKQHTELDELMALDRRVKAPVSSLAYGFGILAALTLGAGMSLIMTDIGGAIGLREPMLPGLIAGFAGMLMASVNYPIYKGLLSRRRRRYARQVMELSARIGMD